jgi:hypothetical protein
MVQVMFYLMKGFDARLRAISDAFYLFLAKSTVSLNFIDDSNC